MADMPVKDARFTKHSRRRKFAIICQCMRWCIKIIDTDTVITASAEASPEARIQLFEAFYLRISRPSTHNSRFATSSYKLVARAFSRKHGDLGYVDCVYRLSEILRQCPWLLRTTVV